MPVIKGYKYNPETISYEPQFEPRWQMVLRRVLYVVSGVLLVIGYYFFYTRVLDFELPKTALIRSEKSRWESKVDVLSRQIAYYDRTLSGIEERNDHVYRSIFGMEELYAPAEETSLISHVASLKRRCIVQLDGLDSVGVMAAQAGDMISHVPAVPPICPIAGSFRISSSFGTRTDPVYGGRSRHEGQDFATGKGVQVYSTAEGVVEEARIKFGGYGKEVLINHGFGYKTRYAHLSKIDVQEGQVVKRGDLVGRVGNSGKSTGPHLHYEVIYRGNKVNPANYMDMEISVQEYRSMVAKRKAEMKKPEDNRITTADILRRRERR